MLACGETEIAQRMTAIERALVELREVDSASRPGGFVYNLDPRAKIVVTVLYIGVVMSFSLEALSGILLFAVYPIILATMCGISYGRVLRKSLYVLPFIIFVGMFNPIFNREPMLEAGGVVITRGWVQLVSITVRGMLAVQAVLLLIMSTGFYRVCRGLGLLGLPGVFTTQLLLLYRYIYVLAEEAISMDRARKSRSYGRKGYTLREWGTFTGQLLLRTVGRAERIGRAMKARGFDGSVRMLGQQHWCMADTVYLCVCTALFAAGRFCDLSHFLHFPTLN